MPPIILSKLESDWPNVKLSVGNHNRPNADTRLLSSPLLTSLSFCVLNHTATIGATDQLKQYSRFPELRQILLNTPNLRHLDIQFEYNWIGRQVKWSGDSAIPRVLNLPLSPSDRLPPLQELTFSGPSETYEFDLEHCQVLKVCIDWSHLRRLDLGISCPQHFIEEIGSSLHCLKSLTMGIRTGERRYKPWHYGPLTCTALDPVIQLIRSRPGLRELNLTDLSAAAETIAPTILESQRCLQNLSYRASMNRSRDIRNNPYAWTTIQLQSLRENCPNLSDLEIDFPLEAGKWVSDCLCSNQASRNTILNYIIANCLR